MEPKIFAVILGMSLVTYIPRMLPLVILSKIDMHPLLLKWLEYIPVAVLSALLAPELFTADGQLALGFENKSLLAAIPCIVTAVKTKNLFLTVFVGIFTKFLLEML